jgi:hypothetical protein
MAVRRWSGRGWNDGARPSAGEPQRRVGGLERLMGGANEVASYRVQVDGPAHSRGECGDDGLGVVAGRLKAAGGLSYARPLRMGRRLFSAPALRPLGVMTPRWWR